MNLLEIANIEVRFSKIILVLKGLSLNVPEKAIVALLGSNGARKEHNLESGFGTA